MNEKKIGWIGLGHMGTPMALNLVKAGFNISVYNRTAEKMKPLTDAGAKACSSIAELREKVDIIFTMLSDDNATKTVYDSLLSEKTTSKLIINMSTISPELAIKLSEKCTDAKAQYLDAPVSGSVKPATEGTLVILAGGTKQNYEEALPYFNKLGKLSLHLGEAGKGTMAKLAINYYMSLVVAGMAETVLFAEKQGINRDIMMQIINQSACGSGMSQMKTPSIIKNDYPAAFPLKYMLKDIRLIEKEGLQSPLTLASEEAFDAAAKSGYSDNDLMAVIQSMKL